MRWLLGLMVVFALAIPAHAADTLRGVALVIGQSDYVSLPDLKNPANDSRDMTRLLTKLGFAVVQIENGDGEALAKAASLFVYDAAEADVALVYYSGHGIEGGGQNYLVPTDGDLSTPELAGETLIPVSGILDDLAKTVPVTILLLDACRSDAFPPGTMIRPPDGSAPVEAQEAGLGELRGPTVLAQPDVSPDSLGMVIGFAASPGQPALDGAPGEANSPYAAALLKHLSAGGYSFGDVMTMVTEEVYLKTKARQLPWVNSSLRRILSFGTPIVEGDADETAIKTGRRSLLLTMASTPQSNRNLVETVATQESVPLDALYGMLDALGVDTSDPSQLRQLEAGALRVKEMGARPKASVELGGEVDRLVALAGEAEAEGAFRQALEFRVRAVEAGEASASGDEQKLQLAALHVAAGDAAWTLFELDKAVEHFDRAAQLAEGIDEVKTWEYRKLKADALAAIGEYKGDNDAYDQAFAIYDQVMGYLNEQPDDDAWANAYNDFANGLAVYGERNGNLEYLDDARYAYNEVLEIWTRDKMPIDWARVQNNLGGVLAAMAERQNDELNLYYLARSAYRSALEEWTRDKVPLNWAEAQSNLGTVLRVVGKVEEDTESLNGAVEAFNLALEEWTQDRTPFDWAMANNNLGNALTDLGILTNDRGKIEEGIAAYDKALEEWTRERVPLLWAATQNNIGATYATLGRGLDPDEALDAFDRAVVAYELCLEERTIENDSWNWAGTNYNLATVLVDIADRTEGVAELERAVAAYEATLQVYDADSSAENWADVQDRMGWAKAMLGYRSRDAALLTAAKEHVEASYDYFRGQEGARAYFEERLGQIDQWLAAVS